MDRKAIDVAEGTAVFTLEVERTKSLYRLSEAVTYLYLMIPAKSKRSTFP